MIQTLLKIFMVLEFIFIFIASHEVKVNESNHVTFKMGKCEDGDFPICMLDNKTI